MDGHRVAGPAAEPFGGACLVGCDFEVAVAVNQGQECTGGRLGVGAVETFDPVPADFGPGEAVRVEQAGTGADEAIG